MSIRIVPIEEHHIEGFHTCIDTVARERTYIAYLQAPPISSTKEFVRSNIAKGLVQLVALDGTDVIGWCDILPFSMEGFTHCGTLGMGILPEYRGRGIGNRLALEAIRRAREQGIERIQLEVYLSNEPAIKLYQKLGFEVEGVQRRKRKLDGVYDDIVLMALLEAPVIGLVEV